MSKLGRRRKIVQICGIASREAQQDDPPKHVYLGSAGPSTAIALGRIVSWIDLENAAHFSTHRQV